MARTAARFGPSGGLLTGMVMAEQPTLEQSLESYRPIEFRSTSEEVATGALVGGLFAAIPTFFLSGLVGASGAAAGRFLGWPTLFGSLFVWLVFWVFPVGFLLGVRPKRRFLLLAAAGLLYLLAFQWYIHRHDIGTFYPWVLSALPFAIVLSTSYEPLRLAQGGSTELYDDRGVHVSGGAITFGNRLGYLLLAGSVLGLLADLLSLGRRRVGATISGLLAGGIAALPSSSLVAWRGDTSVADLFLGNVWTIACAGTVLGAVTGAATGWQASRIRERQERLRERMLESDQTPLQRTSSEIEEAK